MERKEAYRDRSVLIHGKFNSAKWNFQDHVTPPITTASAFRLRSAERGAEGFRQFANPEVDRDTAEPIYIYDRLDEPCNGLLEENLAFSERGECAVVYATGMAAISAALGIHLRTGDHIVFPPATYGCTYSHIVNWLSRYGITHTLSNLDSPEEIERAVRPETKVVYFETPANPTMRIVDMQMVADTVRRINESRPEDRHVVTIVDNTFSSPFCQRPLEHGIDYVVHSLTKHISGFGTSMGGAVIGPRSAETDLLVYRKDFGGSLAPDTAWHIMVYGLPTLALRLEAQQKSALAVANYLEAHPAVATVHYPGLPRFPQRALAQKQMLDPDGNFAPGALIFFEMAGDESKSYERAKQLMDTLAEHSFAITLAVSLGQVRTLIEHPASMTHSALSPETLKAGGIVPGGVRLSLGVEDPRDIISDLESALG
ncbi:MAG: PLP-dependent transferase [Fimbriimonadaceae bacterium]|nr:PLP-dependent transferase [Fimbriimonadaceae bacterium]